MYEYTIIFRSLLILIGQTIKTISFLLFKINFVGNPVILVMTQVDMIGTLFTVFFIFVYLWQKHHEVQNGPNE